MKEENYIRLEFPSRSSNEAFARATDAAFASQLDPTMAELGAACGISVGSAVAAILA